MDKIKKEIIGFLKKETKLEEINLEKPPSMDLGDYAFPCFSLAKSFKKSPAEIAKDIASSFKTKKNSLIKEVKATGPYVNFFLENTELSKGIIKKILKEKEKFGSSNIGKGKKIIVEHTSINPNASPHVGRSRNALIGDSIVRTLRFQGYNVETHFYVNDVGKQIAMLVIGAEGKKNIKFSDLLDIYIKINKKAEKNKKVEKDVFDLLYKLEKGDEKVRKRFRQIVDTCIKGQEKIFSEIGIRYDHFDYESKYLWDKETDNVLKELEKTGKLFQDEDDRWVIDQEGFSLGMPSPVLVLTRGDGTSLYPLRDIAYTKEKVSKGHNIIVLGEDQKLYFQQITAAMKIMGYSYPEVVHYSFVLLEDGKMSTRKGNLVLLENFMEEALLKAKKEISERHEKVNEKTAKVIAYGAIKFAILRVAPEKNVIFKWDEAMNFSGDSAPYIQYSYARICSILRKNKDKSDGKIDYSLLNHETELELVRKLNDFPDVIGNMSDNFKPHVIATFVLELSHRFSEFYHECPVIKTEKDVKKARVALITAVKYTLKNGLNLLGIDAPEKM